MLFNREAILLSVEDVIGQKIPMVKALGPQTRLELAWNHKPGAFK